MLTQLRFRQARRSDAELTSALIQRTIRSTNTRDYDLATIEAICAHFDPDDVAARIEEELLVLCFDSSDEPIGTIGLSGNDLRSMFVDPRHQRKGVGKALVAHLESLAMQANVPEIVVYSSLTARPFYEAQGYRFERHCPHPYGATALLKKVLAPTGSHADTVAIPPTNGR